MERVTYRAQTGVEGENEGPAISARALSEAHPEEAPAGMVSVSHTSLWAGVLQLERIVRVEVLR